MSHTSESTTPDPTPRAKVQGLDARGLLRTAAASPFDAIAPLFPAYDLLATLGSGGTGTVYRARHRRLQREVAIKVLHPHVHGDPAARERFRREALATARLQHPFIVGVIDVGEVEGIAFLVLEYCPGGTLRTLLGTAAARQRALDVLAKVCEAVAYADEQGTVHRDLKPENVLLDAHGHPRVADFGLARWPEPGTPTMTHTGAVMGTPHYMAPEQVAGRVADARADVFALGVMLYEALTGNLPVGRFPPPSARGGAHPDLDEPVMRALDADPERRPSARELGEALAGSGNWGKPPQPSSQREQPRATAPAASGDGPKVSSAPPRVHVGARLACLAFLTLTLTLPWLRVSGFSLSGWSVSIGTPPFPKLPVWFWWSLLAADALATLAISLRPAWRRPRWVPAVTGLVALCLGVLLVVMAAGTWAPVVETSDTPSVDLESGTVALGALGLIALGLVIGHEWLLAGSPPKVRRLRATPREREQRDSKV